MNYDYKLFRIAKYSIFLKCKTTHSRRKLFLIQKRVAGKLKNFAYLGTGNFNEKTAKLYSDHALLTAKVQIAEEVKQIFDLLAGKILLPKTKHLKHLNKRWIDAFVNWTERIVRYKRITVYITSIVLLVVSIIGIYQIDISGSPIEDMPKNEQFFKDIRFFEKEFDGIMPVEIVVDTKRPKGVLKPATLKRIDRLGNVIQEIPALSESTKLLPFHYK